jgi:hypothetical protein
MILRLIHLIGAYGDGSCLEKPKRVTIRALSSFFFYGGSCAYFIMAIVWI